MHEHKDIIIEAKDFPTMLQELEQGFYAIPVFQREFVWEPNNIKALWDSIYRHYPIGSFLIWETEEKIPTHRKLFNIELKSNPKGQFNYILDGQQRITSLLGSIKGEKRTIKKTFSIFFNLKKAFEEKDRSHELQSNLFLDEDEFNDFAEEEKIFIIPVSFLLTYNRQFDKEIDKIDENLADFYSSVCDRLRSKYKLSIIRLNKMPIEEVCEIFTRVNQRGKKLTLVELMTAKTYKQATENEEGFYLRDLLDRLNGEIDDYIKNYSNVIDETIFLRIISVINSKTCREKELLSLSTETIVSLCNKSQESYKKAIKYLKEELKVDSPYLMPYPPMLVPLAYFFSELDNRPLIEDTKKILNSWFWINSFSGSYQGATNEKIHQDCEWFDKVLAGEMKLNAKFSKRIEMDDIIEQELNLNNAFCKAILCILSYFRPIDFFTHNLVNINEIFIKSKKVELHHIFPIKSEIGKKYSKIINSISNICFLPKDTNNHFGKKDPKDYLEEAQEKNKHFNEDIKTHLIPIQEAFSNNFEGFLKNRANMILNEINTFIGITSDVHKRLENMPDEVWNEYELEIRRILDSELRKKYGAEYWQSGVIPEDLKNTVNEKIKRDARLRPDLREQLETPRAKLDNCDVMDYSKIILKNWDLFENKFGSKEETQNQFKNLQVFRNALKHIKTYSDSKELDELTKKKGEVAMLWLQKVLNIEEKKADINIDFTSIDELYSELKEKICSFGQDVKLEQKKHYIAFKRKSNFVCSKIQSSSIKLWIRIPQDKFSDPRRLIRDVSKKGHLGTGDYEAVFNSKEDLDYILNIVKQAYDADINIYNLDYHLNKLEEENVKLKLLSLLEEIRRIDNKITESYSKSYILFKAKHIFCAIYVKKSKFGIQIKINHNELKLKTLDIKDNNDLVWTDIKFNETTDMNELLEVIKQSYIKN
ncbi:MAG: DUF262 domain-containing protein [Nanoarchaeota archaeon]